MKKIEEISSKKKIDIHEIIKDISKDQFGFFNKIGHSYISIRQLVDFMKVIEKNEDDFEDEINILTCKNTNLHPSDSLSLYIVLEAFTFYESIEHSKGEIDLPIEKPSYYGKLKAVRNKIIAHKDNRKEFSIVNNALDLIRDLNNEAKTEKIIQDVYSNFNKIKNLIDKQK